MRCCGTSRWPGGCCGRTVASGRYGQGLRLYVALYTVGRACFEYLRVDHANHLLGLRLNDWTCLIVFTAAITYLATSQRTLTTRPQSRSRRTS